MYTTVNEQGLLNNYATEPKVYLAEYPALYQQRCYLFQGAIATLFVAATVLVTLAVS